MIPGRVVSIIHASCCWNCIESLESGTVFLECKNGAYKFVGIDVIISC